MKDTPVDAVNPAHYRRGNYELIDILEAWDLHKDGNLMQAAQYVFRAHHKGNLVNDLKKAIWYIGRSIENYINESPLTDVENHVADAHNYYGVGIHELSVVIPKQEYEELKNIRATYYLDQLGKKRDKIDMSETLASQLNFAKARREDGWDSLETCPFCQCMQCHESCDGYARQQYLLAEGAK